jgi:two-component sensor histidine kinase/PAS domain-containing protein
MFAVAGLSTVVGSLASRQVETSTSALLTEVAHQMRDKLDAGMFERFRDISVAASLNPQLLAPRNATGWRALVDKLQTTYPAYAWIGFADTAGTVTAATGGLLEGKSVESRPWFREGLRNSHVGDVHEAILLAKLLSGPTDEPLRFVDVAAPVADADGHVVGVLGAHLNWEWAQEVQRSVLVAAARHGSTEMLVIGQNGTVLLGPPDLQNTVLEVGSIRVSQSGGRAVTERWPDGRDYLVGYARTQGYRDYPGLGWVVLARQPLAEALVPVVALQRSILLVGILILLAALAVGWFIASRLASPLARLRTAADSLVESGGPVEIPIVDDYVEVRSLSRSLDLLVRRLRYQEQQVRLAVEAGGIGTWEWNVVTDAVIQSPRCKTILGFGDDLTMQAFFDRLHADDKEFVQAGMRAALAGGTIQTEVRILDQGEKVRWLDVRGTVVEDAVDGETRPTRFLGTLIDITDRVRVTQELTNSLQEKEVLLTEVNHRVKNNLQSLIALMQMQKRKSNDPAVAACLDAVRSRIEVMARIHENLYASRTMSGLDMGQQVQEIVRSVQKLVATPDRVKVIADTASLHCPMAAAVALGLLVNEMITNAIKHAFPGERAGTIRVSLKQAGDLVVMEVQDDGIGDVSDAKADGTGKQLIKALVRQLRGKVSSSSLRGTSVRVELPASTFLDAGSLEKDEAAASEVQWLATAM